MTNRKNILRLSVIFAALLFYVTGYLTENTKVKADDTFSKNDAAAKSAFLESYKVFSSARCVNCHPAGDSPLQGEGSQTHAFLVTRGNAGTGFAAMRCNTCHQNNNAPGDHAPPGAEDWHLPPPEMKMIFEKMSARKLCEQLKNPKKNGGRNLKEVADHLDTPLVRWAWNPGGKRTTPPISYEAFVKSFETWRDSGAACPE